MRWVFVCTANISRSPYAERRMAQLLGDDSPVVVASAGIPGYDGQPMDGNMASQLEGRGGSGADHASRMLTGEILSQANLVLTMEFSHHMAILEQWPDAAGKVRGLGQLARAAGKLDLSGQHTVEERVAAVLAASERNSMAWDVADPYRRGRRAAKKAAEQIDHYLTALLPLAR